MFDLDITLVTWRTRGGELTVRKRGVDIVEASGERKYGEERSSTKIYLATIIYDICMGEDEWVANMVT